MVLFGALAGIRQNLKFDAELLYRGGQCQCCTRLLAPLDIPEESIEIVWDAIASTFRTMNNDVLAYLDPNFKRKDFCRIILDSAWSN